MDLRLDSQFNYKNLLKFIAPSVFMLLFTSIYGVIDGLFVSNFVGKTPFASINFIMPFLMILGTIGFMIGAGGTAIVSKTLGEGDKERANNYFSFLFYATLVLGIIFALGGQLILPKVITWLGADEEMSPYCLTYGRIIIWGVPCYMLQNMFQSFFITAERPNLGFIVTFASGCCNILLDGIFIACLNLGVKGAGIATILAQFVGSVVPIIYFSSKKNTSLLRLGKCNFNGKVLLKTCTNGSSELVNNLSTSIVSIVFNSQLIKIAGQNGVSCYGVMMYVNFIYIAVFIGYAIGVAPIIGFNHGAKNTIKLQNVFKKSLVLMAISGTFLSILAFILSGVISEVFVGYDTELCEMTKSAFKIFSASFVFTGFGIFGSSLFTALGNGLISAVISFLRTIVFQIICVIVLPIFWGINGIWLSLLFAEILSTIVTVIFCILKRKTYQYY